MKTLRGDAEIEGFLVKLRERAEGGGRELAEVVGNTERIVAHVRQKGDMALLSYTRQFDGHETLRLSPEVIEEHARRADKRTVRALAESLRRIREFHKKQVEKSWKYTKRGITLGQTIRPLRRVGVYVPGGKASYPSTVLMNVIPAQVAGVDEIAVCVPTPRGEINPTVMAALRMLKVREVYSIGGAQAVAALAYGTRSIPRVDKIVGPGNIYVATAKRIVFGAVDIDMIAGPSEILIIADGGARADFIAADMLSQAEHDELASSVLLTDSAELAGAVGVELERQLAELGRKGIASRSLRNYGAIILVRDMDEAVRISDLIAPEHLEIMVRRPEKLAARLRNAGAMFLGDWTPEPMGDYAAGPNHTLPTGGTARFSSPLGVYDFVKRTSLLKFTRAGFEGLADTVMEVAGAEGLEAHARAVGVRRRRS